MLDGRRVIKKESGWYETDCPFCDDRKHHLQITPDFTWAKCFRCGANVPIEKVMEALGLPVQGLKRLKQTIVIQRKKPDFIINELSPFTESNEAIRYTISRNVLDIALLQEWKVALSGRFVNRLMVPMFKAGVIQGYVGRHLRNGEPRYLYSTGFSTKNFLYNLDSVMGKPIFVLTEGIFDALAVQKALPFTAGLSCLGKEINKERALEIEKLHPYEVVLMLDSQEKDARIESAIAKMSQQLINGYRLSIARLPYGDPNSVGTRVIQDAYYTRQILRG